ncbi:MAG TPA: NADP-dependent isocitrate dehydrogenase [Atribacterota bacterium]|nr:NADP-dependent isocitrate dehydrogenase [Atribacterota bacterium]
MMINRIKIPYIEGDGIGGDIWKSSRKLFDIAMQFVYGNKKKIEWNEIYAGEKCFKKFGRYIIDETFNEIKKEGIAIKGPLTTPVGRGFRSLNVLLRQKLDLFACIRTLKYIQGVSTPIKNPEKVNVTIFRENTEDIYLGIEWKVNTKENLRLNQFLEDELNVIIPKDSGIGIKPISEYKSKRLVRSAIQFAIDNNKSSVTLVHKGNIMKYTEGAFKIWGYELAEEEFGEFTITEEKIYSHHNGILPKGKILIKDIIADAMFQEILLRPEEYSVIATTNLNGDYLSDAISAQVGGLGLAPGVNIGEKIALFESTHGSAPKLAGLNKANPSSLILSGCMMFDYLDWKEVASCIREALEKTIREKVVTHDLAIQIDNAKEVKCSEFVDAIISNLS